MSERPRSGEAACPHQDELAHFAVGKLSLPRLEVMAEHLRGCARCRQALDAARDDDDPLVSRLRGLGPEDPVVGEPECAGLEARARELLKEEAVPLLESASTPISGRPRVRGFEVDRRLGQGSFGTAYKAREQGTGRVVVLKVLPPLAGPGLEARARFLDDAGRAAAPGSRVLPVLGLSEADGRWVVVVPYVSGASLARIVLGRRALRQDAGTPPSRVPLTLTDERRYVADVLRILDQVLEAVASVHRLGDTYPELRPANVLVEGPDAAWLADYGMARLVAGGGPALAAEPGFSGGGATPELADLRVGAPGYVTPEEWAGRPGHGRRTDVYRLGVLAYQALTLELPYGIAPVTPRRKPPAPPSQRQPLLPAALDPIILKALDPDPERRYPGATEMLADWQAARPAASPRTSGAWIRWRRIFGRR